MIASQINRQPRAYECRFCILTVILTVYGLCAVRVTAATPSAQNAPLSTLTRIAQIRALSQDEARRGHPVRIQGVVTYYDPAWGVLFVQDETGGIFVQPTVQRFEVQPGEAVEVLGMSGKGDYKPVITRPKLKVLNAAPWPAARAVSLAELFAGREDSQWVTAFGVVRTVTEQEGRVVLQIAGDGRRLKVLILALPQGNRTDLIGATVRLTGVCGTITDRKGRFLAPRLFVPGWANLTVEKPAPSDVFTLPVTAISNLLATGASLGPEQRVRIRGVVTGFKTNQPLVLGDGTGVVQLPTPQPLSLQNGVVVDAVGFVSSNQTLRVLEDAVLRRLGYGPLPPRDDSLGQPRASLSGERLPVLMTADQVRRLTPEEAGRGFPVQLRGVITYYDPGWGVMFFQEGTAGIYVDTGGQQLDVATGDWVVLFGYSGPGEFAPVVRRPLFMIEGQAPMPPVRVSTFDQLLTGKEDSQWVAVSGIVRSMSNAYGYAYVKLAAGSGALNAILPGFGNRPMPEQLVDANVRVQGVCGSLFDSRRRLIGVQLFVPSLAEISVERAGTNDPSSLPVQPISSLMQFSPQGISHRARVQGVVMFFRPAQYLYVHDKTDTIYVRTAQSAGATVGDLVDVVGFPAMGDYSRILTDAAFTRIGSGQVPAPIQVSADAVLQKNLDGELIQTEGYLFDTFSSLGERVFVLESGYGVFQAHLGQAQAGRRFDHVPKGSLLQITGICSVDVDSAHQPKAFRILLRSPEDVVVLAQPSWWTLRHVLEVGSILVAIILLVVGWGMTLSHRVRRQTDQIRVQLHQEAALQERYRDLFENANDVIYTHDLSGRFTSLNQAGERVFGYMRADVLAMNIHQLVAASCQDQFRAWLREATSGATSGPGEFEIVTKAGRPVTLELSAQRICEAGQPIAVQVIARDVTERKRAEEVLRRTEALYRRAIAAADAVPYHRDYDTDTFTYFGKGIRELTGYGADEMNPELWESLIQEYQFRGALQGSSYKEAVEKVRRGEATQWQCDCRIVRRDGQTRWLADASVEIVDEAGIPMGSIGTLQDITERKQAEEQMRQQARLLDLAQDAIVVRDLEQRVAFWNKGAERLYGWTAAEAVGRPVTELIFRETGAFEVARRIFLERGEWSGELRQLTKAGKDIVVNSRWNLLRDEQGQAKSVLVINTDITAQKELETQFFRAQRLESVGTLASGIAHDLNNVLAPISLATEMLHSKLPDEESRIMLDTVATSAKRGGDIVRQVLTFARGFAGERVPLQLHQLIEDAAKLMRETFPKSVTLTIRKPNDLWLVEGDATQLHQVLLNLCLNARDAMPDGGRLELRAENTRLDEHFATMVPHAKPGPSVVLEVRDSGAGMDGAILDKIFDPFFTTKAAGKGTGLGLSTVLGIVKSHGGFVNVESQVGRGSTFRVYLPATPDARTPAPDRAGAALPHGHGELVLVVDDEESIRLVTERVLKKFGYDAMTAADGAEALAAFSQRRDAVKVVLTDVMMPNMDGVALVRVLRKMDPQVTIIASSGAGGDGDASAEGIELKALNVNAFLPKPYTAEKLLTSLNDLLRANCARAERAALDRELGG